MRARADWMQYPSDDRILELLEESGLILSPSIMSANLDLTRQHISSRLSELLDHDMVEKTDTGQGHYRITEKGEAYLVGELNEDDL
ncbi:transcriptional regulator [Halobaculum sp. WSA2]|uniref:Transcriptional regulator n=2 Tax=Halobaculum saliterrae TaxID=2073113 RepID=A0A6B0SQ20_9EURY|nr:transcriptional regulator [Halobaculum saliterrae]